MNDVTVIIPCHNVARYINIALQSVAAQRRPADRIIVVDDSSTDGSIDVARTSGVKFDCVRIERRNLAAARNAGVHAATTEWIAFLDGDDFWLPTHLEEANRILKDSDVVAYRSAFTVTKEAGVAHEVQPDFLLRDTEVGLSHETFYELAARGFPNCPGSYVLRRDRYLSAGGSREEFVRRQDIDMWIRCIEGHRWSFFRTPTMCYRVERAGSLSQNVAERNRFELQVWLDARSRLGALESIKTLISSAAWRTVSTAATQGTPNDLQIARQIALPELKHWQHHFGRTVLAVPRMVKMANAGRRALQRVFSS